MNKPLDDPPKRADIPLYALLPAAPDATQGRLLAALAGYCAQQGHALTLVVPPGGPEIADPGHPVIESTATAFLRRVTGGAMAGVDRAVMLSAPGLLTGGLGRYGDILVVDLRSCVAARAGAVIAALSRLTGQGDVRGDAPDRARLTLITSIFRAADYMQGFLFNTCALEDYDRLCRHLFLFSDLSEPEEQALFGHFERVENAGFIWHREDPGLYECWNIGVRLADTPYVSNANVDDLRHPRQARALVEALENTPGTAIAAAALVPFETYQPDYSVIPTDNPWYAHQAGRFHLSDLATLKQVDGREVMEPHCIPHCMPVWRRDAHDRHGFFDEATYGPYADWAFWMEVLRGGCDGILIGEPLSYYFINPGSHNRRGDKLQAFHETVEAEFIDDFRADLEKRRAQAGPGRAAAVVAAGAGTGAGTGAGAGYEPKLNLLGRDQNFGEHRNSFNRLIRALEPLHAGEGGIDFLPFIERTFVWGDDPGEAASSDPRPLSRDWIGVLHVPFDAPDWFLPEVSPERIFDTEMWRASLPACRGMICLSRDLEQDFVARYPDIPALSVLHPTDLEVRRFDPERYGARKRLVQAGDWLRRLQEIYRVRAPGHEKIMLLKNDTYSYLEKDIAQFGDFRNDSVDLRYMISNEDYDDLLAGAVVLCLLYGTAANNLVIECMARATPIIVNPLPGIVEYLGREYPLYGESARDADLLLLDAGAILAAHEYLLEHTPRAGIGYDDFLRGIGGSQFYRAL